MSAQKNTQNHDEKHVLGYERILERTKAFLSETGEELKPRLQQALDAAIEKTTELGELTREEAEKIGDYLTNIAQAVLGDFQWGEKVRSDEQEEEAEPQREQVAAPPPS